MKTIARKLHSLSSPETLRNLSISVACMAFIALMLYVLINSPA